MTILVSAFTAAQAAKATNTTPNSMAGQSVTRCPVRHDAAQPWFAAPVANSSIGMLIFISFSISLDQEQTVPDTCCGRQIQSRDKGARLYRGNDLHSCKRAHM